MQLISNHNQLHMPYVRNNKHRGQIRRSFPLATRYPPIRRVGEDTFADVDPDSYYSAAVAWMRAHGITTGCANDDDGQPLFCPDENATRAHVAAFLYRTATNPESWGENGGILRESP